MKKTYLIPMIGYFIYYKDLRNGFEPEYPQIGEQPVTMKELIFCFSYHVVVMALITLSIIHFNL